MKTKKHTASRVIWGIVYGVLGLALTFMILWNVGLALKWEWCQELTKLFNTDIRQTQYFAATSLLLQVMLIITALLFEKRNKRSTTENQRIRNRSDFMCK